MNTSYSKSSNSESQQLAPRMEALGQSEVFLDFQERLSRASRINRPVLLIGERGTGKELAANRLHRLSSRWEGPLVTLNCAALTATLIESELFGHEAGAFTGADKIRHGRFELAHGGSLFLDEIGNMPLQVQEKVLRVVEYGSFERVGGSSPVRVDVRIIGATNTHLPDLCNEGTFKRDLLDRLSFDVLYVPPLRKRKEDILLLANHFASRMAFELNWEEMPEFSDESIMELESHDWPGNIRELKNVVERAVYLADSPLIEEIIFNPFQEPDTEQEVRDEYREQEHERDQEENQRPVEIDRPLPEMIQKLELDCIRQALREAQYNQKQAAKLLGVTYHQFRWLYRKYKEDLETL